MITFVKTSVIVFSVIFGLGYMLFVPSSVDVARKQYYNECTNTVKNLKSSQYKNQVESGCYLLSKEKF